MELGAWIDRENALLISGYAITLDDAGVAESDAARFFRSEPDPERFVEWFVKKSDLVHREELAYLPWSQFASRGGD